jgi:circadian clock protein KaiB
MKTKTSIKYILKLYVTGETPASLKAIVNLKEILENDLKGTYRLEVIDVLEHPQLAEEEKILATPTLSKTLPKPICRIIGDLSDKQKVLIGLNLIKQTRSTKNG